MKKNIVIIVLVLIIVALISLYLLNPKYSTESTNLLKCAFESQAKLSEYIGKMRSDTLDAYTTEQLLVGSYDLKDIENTMIIDNAGEELKSIVKSSADDIKQKDEIKYYKVDMTKFAETLNIQLINDSSLVWYISDTGILKVDCVRTPDWWLDEFEVFKLN